jgi:hypothetical protein
MGNAPTRTYTRRRFAYDELLHHAVGRQCAIHIARQEQTIEKENGKVRCKEPFQLKSTPQHSSSDDPTYEPITIDGVTEIIEHRKMEPIFYVTDNLAVWKQYQSIGCG